jgi:Secretion system C-terminal sorting domain
MKKSIFFLVLIFQLNNSYSQGNWEVIEIPEEFVVNNIATLFYDSLDNSLWMGGFIKSADSLPSLGYNFLLNYDGNNWKHFGPFVGFNIFDIQRFQDKIVFCGSFSNYLDMYSSPDSYCRIAYIKNDTVGHFEGMWPTIGFGIGAVYGLEVIDDELYCFGGFDSIRSIAANYVAKYDGTNWSTVNDFPFLSFSEKLYCGAKYMDKLYVGGNFASEEYFGNSNNSIASYNEPYWEITGSGITGGYHAVSEMTVFQNELYIGGIIYKLAGNAGNGIQKWNGTEWSSVGDDLKGDGNNLGSLLFVYDLEVHNNNELYIAGAFSYAGDIAANSVVKWDGEKYCSFGGEFNFPLFDVDFMNDTMYVAGGFYEIDGIQTHQGKLAKYIGGNTVVECSTVGTKENDALLQLEVYPSPALNEINIYLPKGNYKNLEVEVYNLLGQKVQYKNSNSLESKKINISIQNFSKGQYTVLLKEKGVAMGSGRFIKE